jgi:DNA polymerase III alpha subunit
VQDLPRHLGQHSGGMVICQGQLDSVVPLEPASMPGRVVVQWDKEDCADMGIIKVDLLGLGMMAVLEDSIELIREHYGEEVDLAHPRRRSPPVYETLQQADTIGMFQVESRAQMSCLPRLRPKKFYDIVVQVAIIRPGPIVGQMVNPFCSAARDAKPRHLFTPRSNPCCAHAGRSAISGATAAHGHDRRQLHRRRSRRTAPRHGLQALASAHERHRSPAPRRHDAQ